MAYNFASIIKNIGALTVYFLQLCARAVYAPSLCYFFRSSHRLRNNHSVMEPFIFTPLLFHKAW